MTEVEHGIQLKTGIKLAVQSLLCTLDSHKLIPTTITVQNILLSGCGACILKLCIIVSKCLHIFDLAHVVQWLAQCLGYSLSPQHRQIRN